MPDQVQKNIAHDKLRAAVRKLRKWDDVQDKCDCCGADTWEGFRRVHSEGCEIGNVFKEAGLDGL